MEKVKIEHIKGFYQRLMIQRIISLDQIYSDLLIHV